jgi:hypothetical protein
VAAATERLPALAVRFAREVATERPRGHEEAEMSAKAGTFEQAKTGVNWTGAWIAAVLLTVIMAVALYATSRPSGTVEPVSQTARYEVTEQLSGGPSRFTDLGGEPAAPAQTGIRIGDTICHQCR